MCGARGGAPTRAYRPGEGNTRPFKVYWRKNIRRKGYWCVWLSAVACNIGSTLLSRWSVKTLKRHIISIITLPSALALTISNARRLVWRCLERYLTAGFISRNLTWSILPLPIALFALCDTFIVAITGVIPHHPKN